MRYRFGAFEADVDQRELRRDGQRVPLEPQAFDVLVHLLQHRDRVVPKEELMDHVWGGRFVTEAAVTSRIKQVRRAVGDDGAGQTHVRTSHGRGYRFVADATEALGQPDVRHVHEVTTTPVVDLAVGDRIVGWQVLGQGPPDVLLLPAVESLGDEPSGLATELAAVCRVISFTGTNNAALDVLDATASARAVLLAEGAAWDAAVQLVRSARQRVAGLVVVDARAGTTAASDLGDVDIPALVLHHLDESGDSAALGRGLAGALPDSEFRAIRGPRDATRILEAMGDLVETAAADEAADQTLTALVGLAGSDVDTLADVLAGLGGRRRRGPEGDVVISFDGPANAFQALGSRRARGLVDEVGVGVAIDEVSRTSELISGHGVDVARFFARIAEPGEVLLPNVIKSLLAGSGLAVTTLEPVELPYVGHHPVHRWVRR